MTVAAAAEPADLWDDLLDQMPPASVSPWFRHWPRPVLQADANDCGAACLATVCRAFGVPLGLRYWRARLGVSQEGTSLLELLSVAERQGFAAEILQVGDLGEVPQQLFPFVDVADGHYTVIARRHGDEVTVLDPAVGTLRVRAADLPGPRICLYLRPTQALGAQRPEPRDLSFALQLLRPLWGQLALMAGLSVVGIGFSLLPPYATKLYYDHAIPQADVGTWAMATGVALAATLVVRGQQWFDAFLLVKAGERFDAEAQSRFAEALVGLRYDQFQGRTIGDYLRRFEELRKLLDLVTDGVIPLSVSALKLFAYVAAFFWVDVRLGVLALVALPVLIGLPAAFQSRLDTLYQRSFQQQARLLGRVSELVGQMRSVRLLNAQARVLDGLSKLAVQGAEARAHHAGFLNTSRQLGVLVTELFGVIFLATVAWLAVHGQLTVGDVSFLMLLGAMVFQLSAQLGRTWDKVATLTLANDRVNDVVRGEREEAEACLTALPPAALAHPEIVCRDVWFRYRGEGAPWVLQGVDLRIRPGERVALLGANGCGKTTLLALLVGLLRPTRGTITVGGVDIADLSVGGLRRVVGSMSQHAELFEGSVDDNLRMGVDEPTDAALFRALDVACARSLVDDPAWSHRRVAASGANLSGGQRQRLALARLLVRETPILCLDECTASVDAATERAIAEGLATHYPQATQLVVSHRRSALEHCTRAVWFDGGKVRLSGALDEVYAAYAGAA